MRRTTSAEGTTSSIRQPLVAADVHELDEAQDVAAAAEMAGHGHDLVVVEAALDHHVDLERRRPAASAAMPASTSETGTSMSFMARKVASSRESRLTVTRWPARRP